MDTQGKFRSSRAGAAKAPRRGARRRDRDARGWGGGKGLRERDRDDYAAHLDAGPDANFELESGLDLPRDAGPE